MSQKIILTEQQYDLIINEVYNEMLKDVDGTVLLSDEPINEGIWTNIKYGLSKLGRYKAGGKILGKGKVDQEAAAKIQQIIDKKGNEVIKNLDAEIKKNNPEFPNNKEGVDFLNTILSISAVYDSIVAATKLDPKDEKYLPIDAANGIINDLREYVKKFLDVDLAAVYSTVDEAKGNTVEISEEELKQLDEAWGLNEEEIDGSEVIDEDLAADVRTKLKGKRGTGDDFASDRMKTLKSNKLPLLLAGIGGALGGLSWLAQTEWFKQWLEGLLGADQTITTPDIVKDVTGGAPDDKGMLHWMSSINQKEGLPPIKTGADVQSFVDRFGADKVQHMFDGNGAGPSSTQVQQLQQLVGGENGSKPVGQLFNPSNDTFGSMKGGQNLFGVSKAASFLGQIVLKKGSTMLVKGAGTALAAKFAGLGAVLGPIGVGVLATGALVKIMRMKGQKQSRAATLNDLYQSIRNLEGGVGVVKPEGETIDAGSASDPNAIDQANKETEASKTGAAAGTGSINDDLYNSLQNLFRFVVASNKKFGAGPTKNTATGAKEDGGAEEVAGGFKVGDRVKWKTKKGTEATGVIVGPSRDKEGLITIKSDKRGNAFDIRPTSLTALSAAEISNIQTGKQPKPKTKANIQEEVENMLDEAKYFRDTDVVKYLNKNLSPDRVKEFENFINRIEQIRNKIRNMKDTDDKVFNQKIATIKNNPIILTDFNRLFNISSANPQAYQNLAKFINDIFSTVYTGKFKKGELINKLATMGKVSAKDLDEAEQQFGRSQFEKDAQDRKKFKGHLMSFLTDAIGLFQYMFQQRKNTAAKGGNQQNTDKQAAKLGLKPKPERNKTVTPSNTDASIASGNNDQEPAQQKSEPLKYSGVQLENKIDDENKLISEEINKINKLISKIN